MSELDENLALTKSAIERVRAGRFDQLDLETVLEVLNNALLELGLRALLEQERDQAEALRRIASQGSA